MAPRPCSSTPANVDMHAYTATVSAAQPAAPDCDHGSSSPLPPPPPTPSPWPMLLLDSGASFHMVGDPRLLSDLRDAPTGMMASGADGTTFPVTKIGDIQMTTAGFRIPGVFLVPGFKLDLISVRQLTRIGICTWFDGDGRATLYAGPELVVGVAVVDRENYMAGFYVLQFLRMPAVWCGYSARTPWLMKPERFTWSLFLPPRVHIRKQLRRLHIRMRKQLRHRIHMQKQLLGLLAMHGGDDGSSLPPSSRPMLLLDSGAVSHAVSDPRLLINLRDAPVGLVIWACDGNMMPVTKIGDIHVGGLTIPNVRLLPRLKVDGAISVSQLARESRICTWFEGDQARLYAGHKLVGIAVAPRENLAGLYILQ